MIWWQRRDVVARARLRRDGLAALGAAAGGRGGDVGCEDVGGVALGAGVQPAPEAGDEVGELGTVGELLEGRHGGLQGVVGVDQR